MSKQIDNIPPTTLKGSGFNVATNGEPHYFRYGKGGIKIPFKNISRKKNVCCVKLEDSHSNHLKEWTYIDNGYATKNKHETQRQGGTSLKGSRKFFKNNE